jgi:hypothetical protein
MLHLDPPFRAERDVMLEPSEVLLGVITGTDDVE